MQGLYMIASTGVYRMHELHASLLKQMKSSQSTLISVAMNAGFLQAMWLPF